MNQWKGILGAGLLACALSFFVVPAKSVLATDCVMPESCSSLAAKAAENFGATDPADYIKTWMFVNCDAQGYFVGAMQSYQNCLAAKADEEKAQQEAAAKLAAEQKRAVEQQRKDNDKKGKPYTTKLEFDKDVKAGDVLKAGKSETVVITYADGAQVTLLPGSSMKLTSLELVDLIRGKALFLFKVSGPFLGQWKTKFEVRTGEGVCAIRGTQFSVDAKATSMTVQVFESTVRVSDLKSEKMVEVNAGYSVVARKNGNISKPKAFDIAKLDKQADPSAAIAK